MNMQMQQNGNLETIEIFDESQSIVEPRDTDVLCGRGGMSNHHPGNEWYRRLIRSNRPLYRACPKHTKLLVSKAIVQAVDEQGGRFLERSRDNGLWMQVSYKRAVDKTSQGLREKDKDDVNDRQVSLPASLRDKAKKPNIRDLAQVTLAHAGLPHTSTFKPPPGPLPNKVGSSSSSNPSFSNSMSDTTAAMDAAAAMPPNATASSAQESLVLPPSLLARSTSVMRLISQTSIFGSSNNNTTQSAPRQNSQETAGTTAAAAPMTTLGGPSLSAFFGIGSNNQSELSAPLSTPDDQLQPQIGGNNNNQTGDAPPTLTRLTTQVSDWLTSFWPVGSGKEEESRRQQQRQILQRQQRNMMQQNLMQQQQQPPPQSQQSIGMNNSLLAQTFGDNRNDNMMPPISQVNSLGQSSLAGGGSITAAAAAANMNNVGMGNLNVATSGQSISRNAAAAAGNNNDSIPLPTELNHSVSATFLKLASSPSKILANFSSLFGANGTGGNNNGMNAPDPPSDQPQQQQQQQQQQLQPPGPLLSGPQAVTSLGDPLVSGFSTDSPGAPPPPPPGGLAKGTGILPTGRRSSKANDLLDDYEESELEARFRKIS